MAAPSLDDAFTQRRLARARRHPLGTLNETRAWIACDGCGAESLTPKAWTDVVQEVIDEADLLTTLRTEACPVVESPCPACGTRAPVVGQRVHVWSGDGDLVVDVRDRSPVVWWLTETDVKEVRPGSPLFTKAAEASTFRMAWNLSWHPDEEILNGALELLDRHQLAHPHDLAAALLRARIELALNPGNTPPQLPEHLASANPTDTASLCALADLCAVLARKHGDGGLAGLAMLWFDKALAKDPESVQALTSKGNLCLDIDAAAKGADLLGRAYGLLPEDDDLGRSLVIALRRAGREDEAKALWRRLVDADPGHPDNQDLAEWFNTPLNRDEA